MKMNADWMARKERPMFGVIDFVFYSRRPWGTVMKRYLMLTWACAALLTGCATQGDLNRAESQLSALEGRFMRLEAESRELRAQLENHQISRKAEDQQLREQSAQLYAALEKLREENRILNGRIDEIGHSQRLGSETGQMAEKGIADQVIILEGRIQYNSERIQRMEQYLNLEAPKAQAPPEKLPPSGGAGSNSPSEDTLYAEAKQAFDQEDFPGARRGFQAFLETFPQSSNADNAQFWIGETYYREKWYEKAILEYQKVIEKYPAGNKVRASLFKQGLSFYNIGDKANARLILKELVSKYPQSEEATLAEKKLKGL